MSSSEADLAKPEHTTGPTEMPSVLSISSSSMTPSSTLPEAPSLHLWKIYLHLAQNIRCLCFVALLGGLCALCIISQLCAPYSSAYCTSVARSLSFSPFRAGQTNHSSCIPHGDCLDSATAARTIQFHLMHAHYMVSLIEGTGLPPMSFFNSTPYAWTILILGQILIFNV